MIENFKFLLFFQQLASCIKFSPPGSSSYTFTFTSYLSPVFPNLTFIIKNKQLQPGWK